METVRTDVRARLQLLFSMFLFGTIGLFVRLIDLPSGFIALARSVIGAVFLVLFLCCKRRRLSWRAIRQNLALLLPAGALLGFNWILLFEAYRYTTVSIATLCYYLAPVFVTLVSPIVLRERLTPKKVLASLVALLGMALASGALTGGLVGGTATGVLLGLSAAAAYACIVLLNKKLRDISSLDTTIVQLGVSALVLTPYVLLTRQTASLALGGRALILLIVLGVVHTGVAYLLCFSAVQRLPAQTMAICSYIDPLVAILLSALLLNETLGVWGLAGALLTLGATLFSELIGSRTHRETPRAPQFRLRPYRSSDAETIVRWFTNERTLCLCCSDLLGGFPVSSETLNARYAAWKAEGLFHAMTMTDGNALVGQCFLRYTDESKRCVRVGFVIVDADRRGVGCGRALMRLALAYAFSQMKAERVTLGVYTNNPRAEKCYRSLGFCNAEPPRETNRTLMGEEWLCVDLALDRAAWQAQAAAEEAAANDPNEHV